MIHTRTIKIEDEFRDPVFLQMIKRLKDRTSVTITETGDIQFEDNDGNWLHICNLCHDDDKCIGIVCQRVSDQYPDGAAWKITENYTNALATAAQHVFGMFGD